MYGMMFRVFGNGPRDLVSIPGRVIPKTQNMVLDASLLNTQHYKVLIKGKMKPSRERNSFFPTPLCSSYRKGSIRVTLDNGHQLFLCQSITILRKQRKLQRTIFIQIIYSYKVSNIPIKYEFKKNLFNLWMEPYDSGHESNVNEEVTSHYPEFHNWNHINSCSFQKTPI